MKKLFIALFAVIATVALADLTPDQKAETRTAIAKADREVRADNNKLWDWLRDGTWGTPPAYGVTNQVLYRAETVADDDQGTNEKAGFVKVTRRSRVVVTPGSGWTNRLSFTINFKDLEDLKAGR